MFSNKNSTFSSMCVCLRFFDVIHFKVLRFCVFMVVFFFWLWGMWDLNFPARIESHPLQCEPEHWTAWDVPSSVVYFLTCSLLLNVTPSWYYHGECIGGIEFINGDAKQRDFCFQVKDVFFQILFQIIL